MDIQNEIASYNVSRETKQRLEDFVALLYEWNSKINLVSKNSLADVWVRHILDSMQLIKYINPNTRNLVDIGSGAGFPGVVLAVLMKEKMPKTNIKLVESITKKTMYLNDVCLKLCLNNVTVVNKRVEDSVFKGVDVITARAVASLNKLLSYAYFISEKETKMIFPKGAKYLEELSEAESFWSFNAIIHKNIYCEEGVVMEVSRLGKKK